MQTCFDVGSTEMGMDAQTGMGMGRWVHETTVFKNPDLRLRNDTNYILL